MSFFFHSMQPQTAPAPVSWASRNAARQQRWDTAAVAKLTADDMVGLLESVLSEAERDMDCQAGFEKEGIDGQMYLDVLDDCKDMIVDVLKASGCAFPKLTLLKLNKALRELHSAHAGAPA